MSGAPPPGRKQGHQRALSSVGNASSLFGGDDQGDFFSPGQQPPPPHQQQQGYGSSAQQHGGISTVVEEDEPESPQLNRRGHGSQHGSQTLFGDASSNDWLHCQQGHPSQQQQHQHYGQEQQQSYDQQGYDYSAQGQQQQQAGYGYSSSAEPSYAANDASQQQPTDYIEPPYYPGYRYDPITNSYLPDDAAQAAASESWGDSQEQSWGGSYDEQGQAQDVGQQAAAVEQPQGSYGGTWDEQQPAGDEEGRDHAQSWDQYHEGTDPYANQADPYAQHEQVYSQEQDQAAPVAEQYPSPAHEQDPYASHVAPSTAASYASPPPPAASQFTAPPPAAASSFTSPRTAARNAPPIASPPASNYQQPQEPQQSTYEQQQPQYEQWPSYDEQADQYGQQAGYDQQSYDQESYDQQSYDQQSYDQQQSSYGQQQYGGQGYQQPAAEASYEQTSYQQPSSYEQPQQQSASYDPYSPQQASFDSYAPQQSTPYAPPTPAYSNPATSPPPVVSPPAAPYRSAFSPPPRTSSVGSSKAPPRRASLAQGAGGPPPRSSPAAAAVAPPPRSAPAPVAAPPQASATSSQHPPPPRTSSAQSNVAPPRPGSASGKAPPPARGAPPRSAAPPKPSAPAVQASAPSYEAPPPARAAPPAAQAPPATAPQQPTRYQSSHSQPPQQPEPIAEQQQQGPPAMNSPPSKTSALAQGTSPYSPPPAKKSLYATYTPTPGTAPARPRQQPPSSFRAPPPVQPRRAPHQRGISAFAGDSPYATIPDMPPAPSSQPPEPEPTQPEPPKQPEPPRQQYAPAPPSQQPRTQYAPPPAQQQQRPAYAPPPAQQAGPREPQQQRYGQTQPRPQEPQQPSSWQDQQQQQQGRAPARWEEDSASSSTATKSQDHDSPASSTYSRPRTPSSGPSAVAPPPPSQRTNPQEQAGREPRQGAGVAPPPRQQSKTPQPPQPPQQPPSMVAASQPPPPARAPEARPPPPTAPPASRAPPPASTRPPPPPASSRAPPPAARQQPQPPQQPLPPQQPSTARHPPPPVQRQQPPPRPQKPIEPEPAPQPEPEPEPETQQAEYEQQEQYDQQQYGEEGAYESQGQEAYVEEDYAIEQPGQHDYEQESWISQEQEVEQQQVAEDEPQRSPAVPELSFEAPSPEFRAQPDHAEEPPLDELDGEVDTQQQQQQQYQAEPEIYINENGEQEDDYFEEHLGAKKTGVESGASTPPAARSSGAAGVEEYGFDDSAVFDGGMSTSTSGSTYGEWTGQSDAHDGYDYVQDDHAGQQQEGEYDPYAAPLEGNESPYGLEDEQDRYGANDIPSRESTYTPPSRSASNFGSPSKPTSTLPATDYPSASTANDVPYASAPYASAPPPAQPVDSYAHYPQAPPSSDPYSARVDGNQTAPASYGAYDSGSTYSPYGAAGGPRQSSEERSAPYDPYSKTLTRQMSTTSLASTGAVPCDLDLERCSAPVVSFGFGGRMLLVFPNGGQTPYSVDTMPYGASPSTSAAPSSPSTVHIRKLDDIVSPHETAVWPGPIYLDGGKANAGKKRKEAVGWLDQRTEELEKEVGYAQGAAPTGFGGETAAASKRKLETRLTLVKLVKVLVENEGKLGGSPKIDEAVRSILVPHSTPSDISDADLPTASQLAFTAPITPLATGADAPFATYSVTPANLDKITSFLLRGERRKAVKYALDHKLWAHAFVISSCVDTDCWTDVVMDFLRSELTPSVEASSGGANGREGMRVAYSMFAGLGAESIQQFVPPMPLAPSLLPQLPTGPVARANSPLSSLPDSTINSNLSDSVLEKWQETAAMIIANRTVGDSAALTALGDALMANGWLDAAHVCYLLSPATSLLAGAGTPATRICLLGTTTPTTSSTDAIDLESIKLTELVEFAFSLSPTVKGQEPFLGFPHLQAFRLHHATCLADAGHVSQALKYTEAIVNTLKLTTKPSPYYTPVLVAQVKALSDRLTAAPGQDKAGSWITRMVPRGPTKESLWSSLEGGFTKFVSGEGEPSQKMLAAKAEVAKNANGGPIGPFSHYSSISPGSTSGTLSRAQSTTDLNGSLAPPSRPASSAATTSPSSQLSAPPHTAAPGPPPVKRAPFKTHHSRSSSLGVAGYNYDPTAPPPWQSAVAPRASEADSTPRAGGNDFSRYGASSYDSSSQQPSQTNEWGYTGQAGDDATLRAPTFAAVDQGFAEDDSGFISPMAQYTPSVSPTPPTARAAYQQQQQNHKRTTTLDELEDLGIGNSKSRKPGFDSIGEDGEAEDGQTTPTDPYAPKPKAQPAQSEAPSKPELKTSQSKSWLGGWFKREASPVNNGPGPVKANLGDQTSFVYDADSRRWVMKGAAKDTATPLATAPPPRAATASPSRSSRNNPPPRFQSETPPPLPNHGAFPAPPLNRAATTNDLRSAGQFRSASTPATGGPPPLRPSSAASGGMAGPPPAGGSGAGVRKKTKPRYVVTGL